MLDEGSDLDVKGVDWSKVMSDCQLVTWTGLPVVNLIKVFPDAECLGGMAVEFDQVDMSVYRFKDAAGNFAFAFDKGAGITSHGSQILSNDTVSSLKQGGARVG